MRPNSRTGHIDVDLRFSDAVIAEARLSTEHPAALVLAVPAYTAGAGTSIGGRTWVVRVLTPVGDEVELTIGGASRTWVPVSESSVPVQSHSHSSPYTPGGHLAGST